LAPTRKPFRAVITRAPGARTSRPASISLALRARSRRSLHSRVRHQATALVAVDRVVCSRATRSATTAARGRRASFKRATISAMTVASQRSSVAKKSACLLVNASLETALREARGGEKISERGGLKALAPEQWRSRRDGDDDGRWRGGHHWRHSSDRSISGERGCGRYRYGRGYCCWRWSAWLFRR